MAINPVRRASLPSSRERLRDIVISGMCVISRQRHVRRTRLVAGEQFSWLISHALEGRPGRINQKLAGTAIMRLVSALRYPRDQGTADSDWPTKATLTLKRPSFSSVSVSFVRWRPSVRAMMAGALAPPPPLESLFCAPPWPEGSSRPVHGHDTVTLAVLRAGKAPSNRLPLRMGAAT